MKNVVPVILISIFTISLIGLGNFVVYRSFITIFDITILKWVNLVRTFFIVGSFSFVVMMMITQVWYSKISSFFYEVSSVWLGTIYFLFLGTIIFLIFCELIPIFHLPGIFVKIMGIILLLSGLGVSIYGVIHSYNLKITEYSVKINNLPEEWNNKKIVMFSDTHFGNIRNLKFGESLVEKINEQNPDLVLIAGDYYDGPHVNDSEIANLMSGVKSKKGIIFSPGNHEEYGDSRKFSKSLANAGVIVLSNEIMVVDGLQIIGVDYITGSNKDSLSSVLNSMNLSENTTKILIKHVPNNLSAVFSKNFDLVVSGHVHQGQVWPGPWITRMVFKEFSYGLNYFGKTAVVTSSGAGTWGPPQRVGTNSEIVVIHLEK